MLSQHWIAQLNANTELAKAYFGHLDAEELNLKPQANTWSIGQQLDHLIVINSTYFPTFGALLAGKHKISWLAKLPFYAGFMGNFILKSVQPENPKKINTFPIWEPSSSNIPGNIVEKFVEHQAELSGYLEQLSNLMEEAPIIASPANSNILYTLPKAIEIIVTHEKRHIEAGKRLIP